MLAISNTQPSQQTFMRNMANIYERNDKIWNHSFYDSHYSNVGHRGANGRHRTKAHVHI